MGVFGDRCWRAVVAPAVAMATLAGPAAVAQAHPLHRHPAKASARRTEAKSASAKNAKATGSSATPDAALCAQTSPTQAFLSQGDFNYYVPAPRPTGTGFDGSTWSLTGGATVSGQTLDLPAGSQAVSADMCVTSEDPEARVMVRSVNGGDNVQVSVSYYGSGGWSNPQPAGGANGQDTAWTLSNTLNLPKPPPPPPDGASSGWQIVRFTLTPGGDHTDFQLSSLSVAVPPPTPSTGPCSTPVLSQAFLPSGDTSLYTPAPGQSGGGFEGTGWTLTGGARIAPATRADGTSGMVLDLPAGSMAVSPNICVTSLYPTARMMIRSLFGGDHLSFRVSYGGTDSWTQPHETGHVDGNNSSWTLSDSVQLQPGHGIQGWQIMRVTLVPHGGHSEFQIYDLELDPYAKR